MGAQYDALSGAAGAPDAELAVRAGAGDQNALAVIFDRYAPRLLGFCRGMLRRPAEAEDCLQDVFVIAATRLSGLREPARLRAWLFAVARHACLARMETSRREVLVDAVPDLPTQEIDQPASRAIDVELGELLRSAAAGLPERDRLVLELADRQGLSTDEVAAALGMSSPSAYKLLTRARANARRSIGALLVARTGREDCAQLAALLHGWNGELTPLLRKRIARHIEDCDICGDRERRLAAPGALLGALPLIPIPAELRSRVLDAAARARFAGHPAALSGHSATGDGWRHGWPPATRTTRAARWLIVSGAAALVVVVAVVAVALARPGSHTAAGTAAASSRAGSPATAGPPGASGGTGGAAARTAVPSSAPAGAGAAHPAGTAPTPRSATASSAPAAGAAPPSVDTMTLACRYSAADGAYVPILTWATSHATGIALSVDNPGVVGSYGRYGPSGTLELPPNGCTPADGTQLYTITTVGGTGPAATRTIRWTPPNLAPPTPTPTVPRSSAPAATTSAPVIP